MSKTSPACVSQHPDCFAYSNGHCAILSNTNFNGKDCPFHKTREQCAVENQRRRERLDRQGLDHLLDKYGG